MIERTLSKKIKYLSSKFPVVCIVGPRQSGKTTLVRHLFQNKQYVSLENLDARDFAEKDPNGFLSAYPKGAVIDEIQRVPQLFSYIQTIVDSENKEGMFVITGSQNILLQENLSQTLAGRVAILRLLPFSVEELKNARYKLNDYYECLVRGFYPRIYDRKIAPSDWYPNYVQTYIERDVRLIKNVTDLNTFQKFVKLCAGRTGQILNLSSLANDCGITHNTAKSWISVLEMSYIIFLLRPYHRNFNRRLIKMPKLYFYDTGLACNLLEIYNKSQLATHYLRGSIFESFVISEIVKCRLNRGMDANCYYWRDKLGNEIDCILELPGSVRQIEVKSAKTVTDDFFRGIRYWNKLAEKRDRNGYVVYGGTENQEREIARVVGWKDIESILK